MKKILTFISLMVIVFVGCTKTNEETESKKIIENTGGQTPTCDTVNMKYGSNIQPIIEANCYHCHGHGMAEGGVSLDSYSRLKAVADNGLLIGVITHANGFSPMPQLAPKLSDCNINKIKGWIARGKLNN